MTAEILNIAPDSNEAANDSSAHCVRVILADSQAIYRVGMRKVFALEDDIRVVAQAETLDCRNGGRDTAVRAPRAGSKADCAGF
jgi:hypothetical protein